MDNKTPVSTNDEAIVLTDRQKEILKNIGLPQEYALLTARQKLSIGDIEEMLQAVELKYQKSFVYVDYTAQKQLESGILTALPQNGNAARDCFTVERCADGSFTDTYMRVLVREAYEKTVAQTAAKFLPSTAQKLYADVLETNVTLATLDNAVLQNNVVADNWLFFHDADFPETNVDVITQNIADALAQQGLYGSLYVIAISKDNLEYITEDNFTDYLDDQYVLQRSFVNIPAE